MHFYIFLLIIIMTDILGGVKISFVNANENVHLKILSELC